MLTRYLAVIGSGAVLALALLVAPVAYADDAKTKEVAVKDLKLDVPDDWKSLPASGFGRIAQFEVPAVEGDQEAAELVISHFGPNGAGPIPANIDRWVKQFDAEDRKLKIFQGDSKQGKYVLVDLSGTWNKTVSMKTTKVANARSLSVILKAEKGGQYYIRLNGPVKTVTANAKALRVALKADLAMETENKEEGTKKE